MLWRLRPWHVKVTPAAWFVWTGTRIAIQPRKSRRTHPSKTWSHRVYRARRRGGHRPSSWWCWTRMDAFSKEHCSPPRTRPKASTFECTPCTRQTNVELANALIYRFGLVSVYCSPIHETPFHQRSHISVAWATHQCRSIIPSVLLDDPHLVCTESLYIHPTKQFASSSPLRLIGHPGPSSNLACVCFHSD